MAAGGEFTGTVNGTTQCPNAGCNAALTSGPLNLTFPSPVSAVNFQDADNGSLETFNSVSFAPFGPQNVNGSDEFLLGTFTYTNGDWFGDVSLGFTLTATGADLPPGGYSFVDTLLIHVTRGLTGNPDADADEISFVRRADLGAFEVYELGESPTSSNTGSIDFYGHIGSLDPTRFANPSGSDFLSVPGTTVPEPLMLSLFGVGFVGVVAMRRRKTASV